MKGKEKNRYLSMVWFLVQVISYVLCDESVVLHDLIFHNAFFAMIEIEIRDVDEM